MIHALGMYIERAALGIENKKEVLVRSVERRKSDLVVTVRKVAGMCRLRNRIAYSERIGCQ